MAKKSATGYSDKPLWAKLGFKPGFTVRTLNAPAHYSNLTAGADGVLFDPAADPADAVHMFLNHPGQIAELAAEQIAHIRSGGMLWVSWAKKSSALHAGVTEDMLRSEILPLGWVDVKVCAVDADWSGLKFLRRRS